MQTNLKLGLITAAVMAVNGIPAHAQDGAPSLQLEEVLVTARKREESLQDVSVAVSAVTDTALNDAHIRNSADLTKLVPSLTLAGGGGSFVIRGIGTQAFSAGVEASVSTLIDGVVLGRAGHGFMQLVDIQRVEVLRGPQGTLFGKNSSGGVVHFITKNPSDEFEADISATAIEHGEYRLGGTISTPVTDTFGVRFTYGGIRDDGYIKNVYDGETYNGGDSDTFRFKARWLPTDSLELKWSSDLASEDDSNQISTLRSTPDPDIAAEVLPVVASEENYKVNLDGEIFREVDRFGHSLEINWDIGDYTVTSISAYRDNETLASGDVDARPTNPSGFDQVESDQQDQFTQELRLTSPGDASLRYVAGLYLFLQTLDKQVTREVVGTVTTSDYSVDTTNYAAFGELTYDFTDSIRGILGGRYTYDELEYDFQRDGFIPAPVAPFSDGDDDSDFSGKVVLEWDVMDDAMTYASYAEGYKGQAYNVTFGTIPPLDPVDPELSETFEIGFKSKLFDNRVMFNATIFRTDYEDFQGQTQIDDGENSGFALTNAGEVRTQGLELDFTGLVSENLTVFGGVAFIDATIESFENGPCSQVQKFNGDCPEGSQDLSGGDLPYSPDWKINLNANYLVPLERMPFDLVAKLAYQGQDDTLMNITQDEGTVQSSYHVFDLALTLEANDDSWDTTIFVKNITDEGYATNISTSQIAFNPGGYDQRLSKNSRRTAGIEFRYRWY
ncbi:MAG: TonB-dependent receptor [Halioglobus sp.]